MPDTPGHSQILPDYVTPSARDGVHGVHKYPVLKKSIPYTYPVHDPYTLATNMKYWAKEGACPRKTLAFGSQLVPETTWKASVGSSGVVVGRVYRAHLRFLGCFSRIFGLGVHDTPGFMHTENVSPTWEFQSKAPPGPPGPAPVFFTDHTTYAPLGPLDTKPPQLGLCT